MRDEKLSLAKNISAESVSVSFNRVAMSVTVSITLRLPLGVHTALSKEAENAGSSLNQENVDRLNASFGWEKRQRKLTWKSESRS